MNVSYADINTTDAAQIFGVTGQAVRAWCKKGYINFIDVAEASSNRPRYLIPDDEVQRVMDLINKYGKFSWLKHNVKPSRIVQETAKEQTIEELKDEINKAFGLPKEVLDKEDDDMEFTEEQLVGVKRPRDDSEEQILLTVAKIREFKEEENNLKGRLVQVQGEIDILEKELKDLIWKE